MQLHGILAAAASAHGTENYPYYLSLLAIIISLIAVFRAFSFSKAAGKNQPQAPIAPATSPDARKPQAAPASGPAAHAIPPEIVAVIAAAVAACAGRNIRIVSIKPSSSSWERAGRQSVLTSHRIR